MRNERRAPGVAVGALVVSLVHLTACDESQVWHAPDWSLGRMQEQPRVDPFDTRMSAAPPFTVARGTGAKEAPPLLTPELLSRGQAHFDTICAACHGMRGDGDSVVASKMILRRPTSVLEPRVRGLSDEQLNEIIARGYGLMPAYENELPYVERVATVAYVRALQVAQGVDVHDLPTSVAAELAREAP
jgi:mono/diheme cytochrome c family protein